MYASICVTVSFLLAPASLMGSSFVPAATEAAGRALIFVSLTAYSLAADQAEVLGDGFGQPAAAADVVRELEDVGHAAELPRGDDRAGRLRDEPLGPRRIL